MAAVNEQRELANEVAEAISTGGYANADFDEVRHGSLALVLCFGL